MTCEHEHDGITVGYGMAARVPVDLLPATTPLQRKGDKPIHQETA